MTHSRRLYEAMLQLSGVLLGEEKVETILQLVVEQARGTLEGAEHAGVTLMREGRAGTVVRTDPFVEEIDDLQYETGEGPCLESGRQGKMFLAEDIPHEARWPRFCELAAKHGVRSVLSYPLMIKEHLLGALNLYSSESQGFSEIDQRTGRVFAAQASVVVANAQLYDDSRRLVDNLHDALVTRAVIEQAKGILMERERIDAAAAFELLKKASQEANVKLRDIARRLVDGLSPRS